MADKLSSITTAGAISAGNVTTSGTIVVDSMTVFWDDATPQDSVISMLKKTEAQIIGYYLKR